MPRKLLIRAGVLMLVLTSVLACGTGLALWYHSRLATPCPDGARINGEPATCFYRLEWTAGWPMLAVVLVAGSAFCLLFSWLSLKIQSPGKAG
ncbi:hypothetical protein HG421_18770 [Xanthomonas campestris pv. badrii]|uniref:Transmembrane protein n=1 Tax=Xanthomonas campestris pv. badrii TaxID=149696 RepID=A0A7Z2VDB1_XANCA|nr:hypothetical protein [Xanthomonas campestris]MCC4605673.1 hypothetical protein [Xanthomonas campestris pv. parthenii]QJD69536.1 hypothetical protein HG421_18770 [Xanthomonas campestris pv. badrii]